MYGYEKKTNEELSNLLRETLNENNFLAEGEPMDIPGYTWKDILAGYEFNQITIDYIRKILRERTEGYQFLDGDKESMILKDYILFRQICDGDSLLRSLLSARIFDLEKSICNPVPGSVFEREEMI